MFTGKKRISPLMMSETQEYHVIVALEEYLNAQAQVRKNILASEPNWHELTCPEVRAYLSDVLDALIQLSSEPYTELYAALGLDHE